jgi:hypothetical protein
MWDSGSITVDVLYWTEGMAEWAPIEQLMEGPEPSAVKPAEQVPPPVEVVDGVYKWFCPHCATKVSVDTVFLEQIWQEYHGKISCPSCSQKINAPQIEDKLQPPPGGITHIEPTIAPIKALPSSVQHGGICPSCRAPTELVQIVCVGCGHNLKTNLPTILPTKYFVSQGDFEVIRKQTRNLKIITYIDLALFAPVIMGAIYCTMRGIGPEFALVAGALPRGWGMILALRVLVTYKDLGIKELGLLSFYHRVMEFADETWWVPTLIAQLIQFPIYVIFLCPVLGTAVQYYVFRKASKALISCEIKN